MKYRLLGRFDFCGQVITLTSSEDERNYVVSSKGERSGDSLQSYSELGAARDKFLQLTESLIYYCSSSDLSLYMQQKAPMIEN